MTEENDANRAQSTEQDIMAAAASLKLAKQELRALMKATLTGIHRAALEEQSNTVFNKLQTFAPYVKARRVSIYLSMPTGEIHTEKIVKHALSQGKEVFVPYLYKSQGAGPKRVMDMVKLRDVEDYESLERDSWGIPTVKAEGIEKRESILERHSAETSEHGLDLILMPGVAFERDDTQEKVMVKRLGHGKGFYDLFLHRYGERYGSLRASGQLYGLALWEQLLQEPTGLHVPVGHLDHLLHGLVVGNGQVIH